MINIFVLLLFILILIIGVREGFFLKWAHINKPKKLSKIWHGLGFDLRATLVGMCIYWFYPDWKMMILILLLGLNWASIYLSE